jgi:pseudouridylate synthase
MKNLAKYLTVSKEVATALKNHLPVVALESTIISHGMPYPQNAATALTVEKIIRENGAIPATIGILEGKLIAGLSKEEINYLGQKGLEVKKVSRRDLPVITTKKLDGSTTVAATMIIAHLAGIKVFVTGGIGGVHREAENTMDISADLEELASTSVAVVCAGAKSILDIGLTLEYLETKGVPVLGYKTSEFPAFYTIKSGFNVDYKIASSLEIAQIIKAKWDLGLQGGIVIANPIPETYAMDFTIINNAIEKALHTAKTLGLKGKEITPFLLDKIKELTQGKSLEANIQLIYNNAKLGAKIAKNMINLEL